MAFPNSEDRLARAGGFLASRTESAPAAQRIYEILRGRIVSLELPPGATLSRVALAKEFDVSLTPIREAMQRLEQDGLIRIIPQSKTVVTKIDVAQLYEVHFLRVAVEAEVARRLAEAPDPVLLKKARAILTMQETLIDNLDEISLFNDLDEAFHQTLFAGVGQMNLHAMLKAKAGHLSRLRRLDLPKEGKVRKIMRGHWAVLEAIEAGNPLAAQEAMRDHLAGSVKRIEEMRREYPDYFKAAA
ncbi:GntR family transcriptional regulator [Pelagibius sp. 7325]|uniref:GntR family transcriptional regulator n=1 Tax=Pelagibius sp. 7325 TaxID=3131994 RepID=UPI0030EB4722